MFSTTTSSLPSSQPDSRSCPTAAKQAAPSGQTHVPSSRASCRCAASSASSVTAIAVPPVDRTASSTRKSPSALGTVMPKATVCGSAGAVLSSSPASNASTIGAQPAAWTATSRGRSPVIQPSSRSSSSAL